MRNPPPAHRISDSPAAYKNLNADAQQDFTRRYDELCRHYGMLATLQQGAAITLADIWTA